MEQEVSIENEIKRPDAIQETDMLLELIAVRKRGQPAGARHGPAVPAAAEFARTARIRRRPPRTARARDRRLNYEIEERRVGKECRSRWSPYH